MAIQNTRCLLLFNLSCICELLWNEAFEAGQSFLIKILLVPNCTCSLYFLFCEALLQKCVSILWSFLSVGEKLKTTIVKHKSTLGSHGLHICCFLCTFQQFDVGSILPTPTPLACGWVCNQKGEFTTRRVSLQPEAFAGAPAGSKIDCFFVVLIKLLADDVQKSKLGLGSPRRIPNSGWL